MINRFALSFLCIELDRDKIFRFFGLYILLKGIRRRYQSFHECIDSVPDDRSTIRHSI